MRSMLQHLLFVTDYSVTSIMNIMLIIILFPVASFYLQQFGVTPFLILEVNSVYCIMSSSYLNFKGDIIAVITIVVIQTIVHWLHSHHLLFPHLKFGVVFYTQNSRLLGLEPLSHRFVTDFRGQVLGFESFQAAVTGLRGTALVAGADRRGGFCEKTPGAAPGLDRGGFGWLQNRPAAGHC